MEIQEGEKAEITAIISPHNADNKTVIWITSDQSIAIVNNGTVLFMAAPAL